MGIQRKTLKFLLENINLYFSCNKKDLFIGELGDQMIKRSCYQILKSINHPLSDQVVDTGYGVENGFGAICSAKELFTWYGYKHISFDLNALHGSLKYDFSRNIDDYHSYFNIFINIGSSEHIGEDNDSNQSYKSEEYSQYYCFKNIHNMAIKLGLMIHMVPLINNWGQHGRYRYSVDFFNSLAKINKYKIYNQELYDYASDINQTGRKCILIAMIKTSDNDFINVDKFYDIPGLFDIK